MKRPTTFYLDEDLANRARSAVKHFAGPPLFLTLGELLDRALEAELLRLAKKYNGGEPIPNHPGPLRAGAQKRLK